MGVSLYPKNIKAYYIDLETFPPLFKAQVKHYKLEASKIGMWLTFSYSDEEAQKQTAHLVKTCTGEAVDWHVLNVVTSTSPKRTSKQINWQTTVQKYHEKRRANEEEAKANEQAA